MAKARPTLIGRWRRLGARRRLLLAEAFAVLAAASTAIRWLPFRRAVRLGSRRIAGAGRSPEEVAELRWSVEAAARAAPWRAVCFQKGLALQWMLRRRGIDAQLHYGIGTDDEGELLAHVWVADGENIVIGGEEAEQVRRVATFP